MTALSRTSKGCGITGTFAGHAVILLACLLLAGQATPTPLPPAVEAVRISLSEPVAAPAPQPEAQIEPEPVAAPEPPAPPLIEQAEPALKKAPEKPRKTPRRKEKQPPKERQDQSAAVEVPAQMQPAPPSNAAVMREARQTLLSALIARIEKEKRYPTAARRLGLEGRVTAVVQVDAQGRIISVRIRGTEAHAVLEKATLEALNRVRDSWKPVPVPEAMTLHIPVLYTLKIS